MKRLSLLLLVLSTASCVSPRGQSHEHWNSGASLNRSFSYHFFSYNTDLETWGPSVPWTESFRRHFLNRNSKNPFQDAALTRQRHRSTFTADGRPTPPSQFEVDAED